MPPIPGLQSFALVTSRGTRLPMQGTLSNWGDEHQHVINEHAIIGRAGALHQSNAQGPRRFTFTLVVLNPGANEKYQAIESTLAADPFGQCTHPRLGGFNYVYNTLRVTEDLDGMVNGLTAELKLTETGLRDVTPTSAAVAARDARSASETLINGIASLIARINNTQPPSVADLTAASPSGVPAPLVPLVTLGAAIYSACNTYVALADDASTDQYALAAQLVQVGLAVESFANGAGAAVGYYNLVAQARLVYGQSLTAYQASAAARGASIVPRRVPGRMSLARFGVLLYGGGAQTLETEIVRLNPGLIPFPYALSPGVELLVPDPARVRLDDGTSPGLASQQQRAV